MSLPAGARVIDTHLHFWDMASYHGHDAWLQDTPSINRNFLPPDLRPHFEAVGVQKGVIVEAARNSHPLNLWWLKLAEQYDYIGAVVAGCYTEQDDFTAWLDEYAHSPYFAGIRTELAGAPEQWASNPATQRGLRELVRRDLSLDLHVNDDALDAVGALAAQHPSLRLIVNHCGSPPIRERRLEAWRTRLAPLAAQPNVVVKYSSLFYYARPETSLAAIQPIAEFLVRHFGPGRLLWGSNWPVELLGGTYADSFRVTRAAMASLVTEYELAAIYGGNAQSFYRVK